VISDLPEAPGRWSRLPQFRSLHPYPKGWLRGNLLAGLTVWAVLVPEALASSSPTPTTSAR
jgi:MFS superfamily sulfate permease-like transporter